MARGDRRKYAQFGLPARFAFGKNFWVGALAGFVSASTALLGIMLMHGFRITGLNLHGASLLTSTAAWSVAFIVVGLAEEFTFRGYLQYQLTAFMGFWPSAFVLSLLFAVAHTSNKGETRLGLLSVMLFGLLFCLILRRTGNLWLAVGLHAGWDWGQTFFYGVPDSGLAAAHNLFNSVLAGPAWLTGGSVGPEASVFTLIILVVAATLISRFYPVKLYPPHSGK
jgi:uncharacterized protein